jgi:uncharacterized protein (TIRG00374 family)
VEDSKETQSSIQVAVLPQKKASSLTFILKKILVFFIVLGLGYVIALKIELNDLAIRYEIRPESASKEKREQYQGTIPKRSSEAPLPWFQETFEFIPHGETAVKTYRVQDGWLLQPGVRTLLSEVQILDLMFAGFFLLLGLFITSFRWYLLLRAGEIQTTLWNAFRLNYIGVFFNSVMPGSTGGDLIKAIFVAKGTPRYRERAVITVLLDRVLGLISLLMLAGFVVFFKFSQFKELAFFIYGVLALVFLGFIVLFNTTIRRWVHLEWWLTVLPLGKYIRKIDEAFLHFKQASSILIYGIILGIFNHSLTLFACYWIGQSLGDRLPFLDYFVLLAVGNILVSIPLTPGAIGVREFAWGTLFEKFSSVSSYNRGVVLATTYFVVYTLINSLGGFFLLTKEGKEIRTLRSQEK